MSKPVTYTGHFICLLTVNLWVCISFLHKLQIWLWNTPTPEWWSILYRIRPFILKLHPSKTLTCTLRFYEIESMRLNHIPDFSNLNVKYLIMCFPELRHKLWDVSAPAKHLSLVSHPQPADYKCEYEMQGLSPLKVWLYTWGVCSWWLQVL